MGVITWIIVGIVCGVALSALTDQNQRIAINILAGIAGAVGAGFLTNLVTRYPVLDYGSANLIMSIVGAALTLFIANAMRKQE